MPKTTEEINKFIEFLEDAGYDPKSYSGRGMFGKRCVSIQENREERISAWEVARCLWFNNFDEEDLDVPAPQQDSMGLGIVLYWPSYKWPDDRE